MSYFDKCKLKLLEDSIISKDISDEVYFSKEYSKYTSNSRLKLINPDEGGSCILYEQGFNSGYNPSLEFGTAVHELLLQSESFELIEYYNKPAGKLGRFIEELVKLEKLNKFDLVDITEKTKLRERLMKEASDIAEYYKGSFTKKRMQTAMEKGRIYYDDLKSGIITKDCKKEPIILPPKMLDSVYAVMSNLEYSDVIKELENQNLFGTKIISNEEALFADFIVTLADGEEVSVPFKLKIDNYNIDEENGVITLNDLKTTGKRKEYFMGGQDSDGIWHNGSFQNFHYYRQLAAYFLVLQKYLKPKYPNISKYYANILLIESIPEYANEKIPINREYLKCGLKEFKELMIRVAYYERYGTEIPD